MEFTRPAHRTLTLIGCGLVVAGRTGIYRHFMETFYDVRAQERLNRLVLQNKTASWPNYK